MSYIPPAGDEINFTWVGEAEYTPPAGDEINFSWEEAEEPASDPGSNTLSLDIGVGL